MNYSSETKPSKILNLKTLKDLNERLYFIKNSNNGYFSFKKPENNTDRVVFNLETSNVNIQPIIRNVICVNKNKRYNNYQSFTVQPKDKSTGIVMIKLEENKTFFCNVRILPLNTLSDIAEPEIDSKLLTVNIEKSKCILKTDITITSSNTGETLYSVHEIDVNAVSYLLPSDEIVDLKRELEFQVAKLTAHYFQEILDVIVNEHPVNNTKQPIIPNDYIINFPNNQLKEIISANAISACIALEIIGSMEIQDLNRDWTAAGDFIGYLL